MWIENYWKIFLWKDKINEFSENIEFIKKYNFNTYQNNSGNIISVTNENCCITAVDTRCLSGFSISSRFQSRVVRISKKILLSTSGMFVDSFFFQKKLRNSSLTQHYDSNRGISLAGCASHMLSLLYSKRFFPYYSFNILSGLDEKNKAFVYAFDAIGSFEKLKFSCIGDSQLLIQPLLDGHFGNQSADKFLNISFENLFCLLKEFLLKISKKGIYVGDGIQFFIITKKGILLENYFLKIE